MDSAFVNGYISIISSKFSNEELRTIRDSLYAYSLSWEIKPLPTAITTYDYQLPEEYKWYMVSKAQDCKLNGRSIEQYKKVLEKLLFFLKLPVKDITTQHLRYFIYETFRNKNTGEPLSPYTSNQRKSIIRSFFSWCFKNGLISSDPSAPLLQERTSGVEPRRPYTEEEAERLRDSCETPREKAVVELLFSTGARADECINIKRSDIDMHERTIRILGKGNKLRTVFFNVPTKLALQKYWKTLPDDVEYAFVRERRPYDKLKDRTLNFMLKKLEERANVKDVIPHRFRHTFATRLEERGCPIEVIQELLGHSNLETTTRYAHQNKSRIKAEYNKYTI